MDSLWRELFDRQGFYLFREALGRDTVNKMVAEAERLADRYPAQSHGLRGLLHLSAAIHEWATDLFGLDLARQARPLRAILFDKRPNANWRIGWHQDTNLKEDDVSVVSNEELARVFTLRLHLDPTPASNGALRCLPGSHLGGRQPHFRRQESEVEESVIEAEPGDILMMRPLLFHASSPATQPGHRRVIHVDYLEL